MLLLRESFFFAAYMSSPCHIELILSEKEEPVKKEVMIDHLSVNSIYTSSFLLHQILIYYCSCRLRPNWQQARRRVLFEVVLHLKLPLKLVIWWPTFLDYVSFVDHFPLYLLWAAFEAWTAPFVSYTMFQVNWVTWEFLLWQLDDWF